MSRFQINHTVLILLILTLIAIPDLSLDGRGISYAQDALAASNPFPETFFSDASRLRNLMTTTDRKYLIDSLSIAENSNLVRFTRGYLNYERDHLQSAKVDFQALLHFTSFPLEDYVLYYLGDIHRQHDLLDSTALLFQQLFDEHPHSLWVVDAGQWLSEYYLKRGMPEEAVSVLNIALACSGLDDETRFQLLSTLQTALRKVTGRRGESDSLAVYLWREYPQYYDGRRPDQVTMADRFTRAERLYERGANISSRKSYTYLKKIAKTSDDKIKATIGESKARFSTRYRYYRRSRMRKAANFVIANLKPLTRKTLSSDDGSETYYWLGQAYQRLGKTTQARKTYELGLKTYGEGRFAYRIRLLLAKNYLEADQVDQAQATLQSLSVQDDETNGLSHSTPRVERNASFENRRERQNFIEILWDLGWTAYLRGQWQIAERVFAQMEIVADDRSWFMRGLYWQGRAVEKDGRLMEAASIFQRCAEHHPYGYYGIRSQERLDQFPDEVMVAMLPPVEPEIQTITIDLTSSNLPPLDRSKIGSSEGRSWLDHFWDFWQDNVQAKLSQFQQKPPPLPIQVHVVPEFQLYREQRAHLLMQIGLYELAIPELKSLIAQYPNDMRYYAQIAWVYQQRDEFIKGVIWMNRCPNPPTPEETTYWYLYYPLRYWDIITRRAVEYELDPLLMTALIHQESAFNPRARSWAGARGLTQVISSTGRLIARRVGVRRFHPNMLYDPELSIQFGSYYLNLGLQLSGRVEAVAVAGYNCGVERAARWWKDRGGLEEDEWIETIILDETRDYTKKVLRNYHVYQKLYARDSHSTQNMERGLIIMDSLLPTPIPFVEFPAFK